MTERALLLLVLSALVADGALAAGARVVRTGNGVVWLDRGADAGLAPGAEVRLRAGRRGAGTCVVDDVSASWATCRGELRRAPTRARFSAKPPAAPVDVPAPSPVLPADELRARKRALGDARFAKVRYTRAARARARGWRFPMSVSLIHRTWARPPVDRNSYHREHVELSLRGVPLLVEGLTAWADAAVVGAFASPSRARYRPRDVLRVEVHEAAVSYRPRDGLLAATVGRFVPFRVAGATLVDGAQLGVRLLGDAVEVGAFAGTRPEPFADLPSLLRFDAGGYWSAQLALEDVWIAHRGRLGLRTSPALAGRGELDALVDVAAFGVVTASAGVRAGLFGDRGVSAGVDLAYGHLRLQGPFGLSLGGGYRYFAPAALDVDLADRFGLPRAGRHHGDATLGWSGVDWLDVALDAGGSVDVTTLLWRAWAGPRVSFPRALFGLGGAAVSYQEALGAPAGRAASARAWVDGFEAVRVRAGVFYWEDVGTADALREGALSLGLDTSPLRWLQLGARARAQLELPSLYAYPTPGLPTYFGELYVTGAL